MVQKKTVIDTCAFIERMLLQGRHEYYEEQIKKRFELGDMMCVTPTIIREVIDEIEKEIEKKDYEQECTFRDNGKKLRWGDTHRLYNAFKNLLEESKCSVIFPSGEDFVEIMHKCHSNLHSDERDKLNIATAISNNCSNFITGDEKIFDDEQTIKKIANTPLTIIHIKK